MNRVIFQCVNDDGEVVSVTMESTEQLDNVVHGTAKAFRERGLEVIAVSRIEMMEVHIDPMLAPAKQTAAIKQQFSVAGFAPMKFIERAVSFGGLALAIIGFDDGLSIESFARHAAHLMPLASHFG